MSPNGQIVIIGSDSHRNDLKYFPKKAAYAPLKTLVGVKANSEPAKEERVNGWQRYGTSKMLQMMTGHEVSARQCMAFHLSG
jgi:hypothetical protein